MCLPRGGGGDCDDESRGFCNLSLSLSLLPLFLSPELACLLPPLTGLGDATHLPAGDSLLRLSFAGGGDLSTCIGDVRLRRLTAG